MLFLCEAVSVHRKGNRKVYFVSESFYREADSAKECHETLEKFEFDNSDQKYFWRITDILSLDEGNEYE